MKYVHVYIIIIELLLQWHHNKHDGVSNHQRLDCLLSRLFRRRSKKTSKLRITGLCEGNSPVTGEFPTQRTSNAENVSIWWRHRVTTCCILLKVALLLTMLDHFSSVSENKEGEMIGVNKNVTYFYPNHNICYRHNHNQCIYYRNDKVRDTLISTAIHQWENCHPMWYRPWLNPAHDSWVNRNDMFHDDNTWHGCWFGFYIFEGIVRSSYGSPMIDKQLQNHYE